MEYFVTWITNGTGGLLLNELRTRPSIYDAAKVAASRLDISGNLTYTRKKDMQISVMWKKLHVVK
jgi:hypothetical protein